MITRPSPALLSIAASLSLLTTSCSTRAISVLRTDIQDLQNRIYEMQKRQAETEVAIQELRDRTGGGAGSAASTGGGQPGSAVGQADSFEEPAVPGSTIDIGGEGPTRNVEPGPVGSPGVADQNLAASHPSSPGALPGAGAGVADKLYTDGYAQFNTASYQAAQQTFQEFLARSPQSDLADDAQYWIGECSFALKDYRRAILEFRKVVDQYPFGNRVPHAFLKIGLSYLALGERDRAAENLETVVEAFPKSDVATVARATLDDIRKR